ncbi:MAG: flagellar biosynthetic protein FliR [Deltaproteobacteria bacterium]|nr:flagellar biosynthetic protein FliR [Deltaproteobacteria bacterium]
MNAFSLDANDIFKLSNSFLSFLFIGGLIFIRIMVALSLTPYLGARPVLGTVRTALAFALTVFCYPLIAPLTPSNQIPENEVILFALFLKEAFYGMLLGLINTMVFYGIQSAGNMVDNQRYVANARIFNPALASQASLLGVFLFQFSIVIFILIGGHCYFLEALITSFQKVPLLTLPTIAPGFSPLLEFVTRLSADTLIICLQLSAPIIIAIFIADLVLGIMNRIAPMINVFEMGFSIKGFSGVLLFYLALPVIVEQSQYWFKKMIFAFHQVAVIFS